MQRTESLYTYPDDDRLSKTEIVTYGMGGLPGSMLYTLKTSYHMAFLTDVAGLSAAFVGTWNMILTIWDAINDPIIGNMADQTNTRWGKYRPHIFWGVISWAIITIMMFSVPNLAQGGKSVYYVSLLFLWSIASTAFMVPWQALNSVMSRDLTQRNQLLTLRTFIGTLSGTILAMILVPLVQNLGGIQGYRLVAIITAIIGVSGGLICAYGVRKQDYRNSIPTPPKVNLFKQLARFAKNKAVMYIALMLGLVSLVLGVNTVTLVYYHTYVTKQMQLLWTGAFVGMAATFIALPIMPWMYKRFGRRQVFIGGIVLLNIQSLILLILREHASGLAVLIGVFFFTAGLSISNMTIISFIPDSVDYTEYHFGSSEAGIINAIVSFVRKFVSSFTTLIVGVLLSLANYKAGMEASPKLISTILGMKTYLTIGLSVMAVLVLYFYPITEAEGHMMRQELKRRHSQSDLE